MICRTAIQADTVVHLSSIIKEITTSNLRRSNITTTARHREVRLLRVLTDITNLPLLNLTAATTRVTLLPISSNMAVTINLRVNMADLHCPR